MTRPGPPSFIHVPELCDPGGTLEIGGDEAHYLARVVRVRPGQRFEATDGDGAVATLEVLACGACVLARVESRDRIERAAELELWCGAPEGDRADWLVEKLAELGVARLRPVDGERGRWERFAARRARWDRLAIAALRQSRSAYRLRVLPPLTLAEALAGATGGGPRWACRPDGRAAGALSTAATAQAIAAVGPSSGFSEGELNLLQEHGFEGIALAASRLRTETAALAVASLWAAGRLAPDGGGHGA